MISYPQRDPDRGGYIIGMSIHSQRVERLRRDVFSSATRMYYKKWHYLEETDKLWVSEVHIWALEYTFAPNPPPVEVFPLCVYSFSYNLRKNIWLF